MRPTAFPAGVCVAVAFGCALGTHAQRVVRPVAVTLTGADEFYSAQHLIDGSGLEFQLDSGSSLPPVSNHRWGNPGADSWVTGVPGGFPSDWYQHSVTIPTFVLDLGQERPLDAVHLWAYSGITGVADTFPGNSARTLEFRFNTAVEGSGSFTGPAVAVTMDHGLPSQVPNGYVVPRQDFALGLHTARWIEMRITDNWFATPGDGTSSDEHGHLIRGGDRVGLGEIRFSEVPEPLAWTGITGLGLLGFVFRRHRTRSSAADGASPTARGTGTSPRPDGDASGAGLPP